ncbi:hypothetical protein Hdeb2414_s0002g00073811 [Helianthus debilis subsp. tardiflorus]
MDLNPRHFFTDRQIPLQSNAPPHPQTHFKPPKTSKLSRTPQNPIKSHSSPN